MRIAVAAVALSMMVMILATSIVRGFKQTISEKVFGFWGHIHISAVYGASHLAFEPVPMSKKQPFYPHLDTVRSIATFSAEAGAKPVERQSKGGVRHIQVFANKEGIIKTADEIEGIILRGIGSDYDWNFLRQYITAGDTLDMQSPADSADGILLSEATVRRLKLQLGERVDIYFVHDGDALARRFRLKGIYKTGLEEYDRKFALVDIRQIQQLNGWRPFQNFGTELELAEENAVLVALTGATAPEQFANILTQGTAPNWDDAKSVDCVVSEQFAASRNLKVGDSLRLRYYANTDVAATYTGNSDSAVLVLRISALHDAQNRSPNTETNWQPVVFLPYQRLQSLNQLLPEQISGFEVFIDNLDDLDDYGIYIEHDVLVGLPYYSSTIKQLEPTIFDWLNLTDMNERIILIVMILVAIINMTTSLLILILERTNMIGTLKALGATNWTIRRIFLYYAAYIIGYGLLWGNVLAIALALLQNYFGFITLPEDLYYISTVPVHLDWLTILALNVGTLVITLLVLVLPSYLVARIDPVKAIRFK